MLIVTPGGLGERGGIGRLVNSVIRHWKTNGSGPAFRIIDPYGPAIRFWTPFFFIKAIGEIIAAAAAGRGALMHVHMAAWGSALRKGFIVRLAAGLGMPVMVHVHGADFDAFCKGLPRLLRRLLVATLRRADRVVVLGAYWQRFMVEGLGLDPRRVIVLSNAVAGPSDPPRHLGAGPCRILFLGRIEAAKGLHELLEALADARVKQLHWTAQLAGAGAIPLFERQARELGLSDRVQFAGWRAEPEVREMLANADIFVLPSHNEGQSIAMLEAMAYGLAVIVTPVGATGEVIVDGESGLLVPVGDRDRLAAALERLISDPEFRARLQAGAWRQFNQNFEISGYCQRLEALYRELIESPAAS